MQSISAVDERNLQKIRADVSSFVARCGNKFDNNNVVVLDIAPQDHEGANPYFSKAKIETLDIDKNSGATYIADICKNNHRKIPDNHFDYVVCTEVLEHTLQPFDAVKEIHRILKPGGIAIVSAPFNFRIHGPLPDCWRFTEHGLRALFKNFIDIEIEELVTKDRFLMPIHYTMTARKKHEG